MKKLYFYILLVVLPLSLFAKPCTFYENTENDQDFYIFRNVKIVSECMDNKMHGMANIYTKNHHSETTYDYLVATIQYKNGVKNGAQKQYFWNTNKIKTIVYYKNNKKYGKEIEYYIDSKVKRISIYKENKLDGKQIEYDKDSKVESISTYKDNKLDGEWIYHTSYGTMTRGYKSGKRHGATVGIRENGNIYHISNYENARQISPTKNFYENGNLQDICTPKDNILTCESFYKNGNLHCLHQEKLILVEGYSEIDKYTPHGEYKCYHENGQLRRILNYSDGIEKGEDRLYDANGLLIRKSFKENNHDYPKYSSEYLYDNNGNLINEYHFDGRIAVDGYSYENGQKIKLNQAQLHNYTNSIKNRILFY
ncbi:MAG: hypothetical protein Q8N01_04470 [Sulfuricurvum sp.]|nr:hypothetical protein [Sulfuricurvum sp.]